MGSGNYLRDSMPLLADDEEQYADILPLKKKDNVNGSQLDVFKSTETVFIMT